MLDLMIRNQRKAREIGREVRDIKRYVRSLEKSFKKSVSKITGFQNTSACRCHHLSPSVREFSRSSTNQRQVGRFTTLSNASSHEFQTNFGKQPRGSHNCSIRVLNDGELGQESIENWQAPIANPIPNTTTKANPSKSNSIQNIHNMKDSVSFRNGGSGEVQAKDMWSHQERETKNQRNQQIPTKDKERYRIKPRDTKRQTTRETRQSILNDLNDAPEEITEYFPSIHFNKSEKQVSSKLESSLNYSSNANSNSLKSKLSTISDANMDDPSTNTNTNTNNNTNTNTNNNTNTNTNLAMYTQKWPFTGESSQLSNLFEADKQQRSSLSSKIQLDRLHREFDELVILEKKARNEEKRAIRQRIEVVSQLIRELNS